jgi:hypothetical protein
MKNTNNLFKHQLSMHQNYVLRKISAVELSSLVVN